MELPEVRAEINFSLRANCPFCRNWSEYQQLSAAHANVKNALNRKAAMEVAVKCTTCDKHFRVKELLYA